MQLYSIKLYGENICFRRMLDSKSMRVHIIENRKLLDHFAKGLCWTHKKIPRDNGNGYADTSAYEDEKVGWDGLNLGKCHRDQLHFTLSFSEPLLLFRWRKAIK